MTTVLVPSGVSVALLRIAPSVGLREPTENRGAPEAPEREYFYAPDLTAGERAILDRLVKLLSSSVPTLSPGEWEAMEPAVANLRAFRTQSAAEFSALTAAQRDAALRTALFGVIDVLRALLRD